jgi:pantetheine-phosphate adenylyltransferase
MRLQRSRVILRGLRALSDFEYEFQLAQMNKQLAPETETFFMVTDAKYSYLSSRGVKEVFNFGGAIQEFVPPGVFRRMRERVQPRRSV